MRILLQDLRYAVRLLLKNPGFAVVAVLTLTLGIGANTAIFSVLDCVLLRTLPVANPEELSVLTDPDSHGSAFGGEGGERSLLAYSEFQYLRDHNDVFSHIFAADSQLPNVDAIFGQTSASAQSHTENLRVRLVSGDYFDALGVKPAAGQVFTPEVDRARGGAPVAVISYAFWKRRLNLDPSALGTTIQIRNFSFLIVGVSPPGFFGETVGQAPDVWVPILMADAFYPGRDLLSPSPQGLLNQHIWLQVMGRRKPGITNAQANASLNVAFKSLIESLMGPGVSEKERREFLDQRLKVQSAARGASTLHEAFAAPLKFLMALVVLVLLIACVNVANLQLARGAAREKEFVMRLAVGADRSRLVRQLLTESLLLAILGATAGILVAFWADSLLLRMVQGVANGPAAIQLNLQPDAHILGFTLLITLLTAALFGLFPSLHATKLDLGGRIKSSASGAQSESSARRVPLNKALVVAQVTFSLVLLVAAGLFVHSLAKLSHVNLGYNRENLLLFRVNATGGGYRGAAITRLYQDLLARISAVPGLRGVTVSHNGLFSGAESGDPIAVEGYTPKPDQGMNSRIDAVGPGYFSTLGIPILLGREINAQDTVGGLRAAVVNETFAQHFFANTNPIGKHIRDTYPGNPGECVVVGVTADARYNSLREKTPPRIYLPLFNPLWEQSAATFEVRTFTDPASVSATLRSAVQEVNQSLLPISFHAMTGLVDETLQTDRFIERLSSAFGFLAILLASIGLYGVTAYNVARRTRDIGIRMALGAEPGNVLWHVLRETLVLVCIGIALGIPAALAGTRLVRSLLFGLGFADPIVIVSAAAVLALVAALAGFLPARRASQVDPMVALRYELFS
jgi:putative ABC transport system permease protein